MRRILWFGLRVSGKPSQGSDVDVCRLLTDSDTPFRGRIPDSLRFCFPVGMDVFPYTLAEFERLRQERPSWFQAIISWVELDLGSAPLDP